jgi:uncharacterized membrane protein YdjX (TVP38/TMEM64 family)
VNGSRVWGWLRILAPVLASIIGLTTLRLLGPDLLDQRSLRALLAPLGAWAPLVFITLLSVRPVTLLPGQIFAAVGGILFGTLVGTLYALAGSLLAAMLVFFLSRRFGTRVMRRFAGRSYEALSRTARQHDFKVTALATLNPLVPTDLAVAVAGASGARFWPTALGVIAGTLPGTILTVQFGSALGQGKTILTAFAAVGMVLSMVLGVLLGRRVVTDFGSARRELHARARNPPRQHPRTRGMATAD